MLTISEVLMWCYPSLHYPNQTEPSRWQRIVALKKWHNAFTSNYSFRCLKKTKKNLDIVIRHLLWKLVQECEEFPVNQARTKVYSALCHGTNIQVFKILAFYWCELKYKLSSGRPAGWSAGSMLNIMPLRGPSWSSGIMIRWSGMVSCAQVWQKGKDEK